MAVDRRKVATSGKVEPFIEYLNYTGYLFRL